MTHTLDSTTTLDTTTDTMRAAVVTEFGAPLEISDLEPPTLGYGEALVKLETSGVCHTDLHAAHGDWPVKPQPPFIPGHEGYGTVVALGDGVDDLKIGDKVGNAWLWSACGRCEYCRTGWETLCESQQNGGYSVNGSFGTYMLVNAAYAPRIPDNVDPLEIAPILCAGVTVCKDLKVTDTRPGQWVAIYGIGGLGHLAVQYARAVGLRVVAVDIDDSKLALATRLGAEVVVNARTSDVVAEVQKATGGVHGVLEGRQVLPGQLPHSASPRQRCGRRLRLGGGDASMGAPPQRGDGSDRDGIRTCERPADVLRDPRLWWHAAAPAAWRTVQHRPAVRWGPAFPCRHAQDQFVARPGRGRTTRLGGSVWSCSATVPATVRSGRIRSQLRCAYTTVSSRSAVSDLCRRSRMIP
jgi:alcohol dehydrogenase, propanol-preferring